MRMIIYGLIGVIFAASTFAQESDKKWKHIVTSKDHNAYYVHTGEKVNVSRSVKRAWVKVQSEFDFSGVDKILAEQEGIENEDKNLAYKIELFECNCRERRYRVISTIKYAKSGEVLDTIDIKGSWSYAVPESIGYSLLNFICMAEKRKR